MKRGDIMEIDFVMCMLSFIWYPNYVMKTIYNSIISFPQEDMEQILIEKLVRLRNANHRKVFIKRTFSCF